MILTLYLYDAICCYLWYVAATLTVSRLLFAMKVQPSAFDPAVVLLRMAVMQGFARWSMQLMVVCISNTHSLHVC